MQLKGKALFNLLRMSVKEDRKEEVPFWQVEDLRELTIDELFFRLGSFGASLDKVSFSLYAESCDTPEDLTDCLFADESEPEKYTQVYLILFELWRRLVKDKFCISIFCDELDYLIEQYDQQKLEIKESLQMALGLLEDILDEALDEGADLQSLLKEVSSYCAHDLEQFLIDYITDQIEEGDETYASELIEAFIPYASNSKRFELLKVSLIALSDIDSAHSIYEGVFEDLKEEPDIEWALQFVEHLVHHGHLKFFVEVARFALSLVKFEEQFQELLFFIAEYYRCSDRESEESQIQAILEKRAEFSLEGEVDPQDPDLKGVFSAPVKE